MQSRHALTRKEFLRYLSGASGYLIAIAQLPFVGFKPDPSIPTGTYSFPQGVASGDPTHNTVLLWTRVISATGTDETEIPVTLQVSLSKNFASVIVEKQLIANKESDFTLRVLVESLEANSKYYYRFIAGSDISEPLGRTFTAPKHTEDVPFNFAFVSCQHLQLGYMTPYRRMIFEDQKKKSQDQIKFILHLGDFIYEEYWHPEERENGTFLRRKLKDNIRLPDGGKIEDLRYPVSLDDYRQLYKLYISDPDLKAARARWPFICTWDDHEFSNNSWQSKEVYEGDGVPGQQRKMAANQAWFEYIPALLSNNPGISPAIANPAKDFEHQEVENTPMDSFDETFLATDPNNIAAIESLIIYRTLQWGKYADIIITDNRSFRSPPVPNEAVAAELGSREAFWFTPEEVIKVLDAGKYFNNGSPPEFIKIGDKEIPNYRKNLPSGTVLGHRQKNWFLNSMQESKATWKLWANSFGTISRKADLQNLPDPMAAFWKTKGYGIYGTDDWIGYPSERAEIIEFFKLQKLKNLVSLSGDRHNFTAGNIITNENDLYEKPVAVEFGVSSITTPTSFEAFEYVSSRITALRELYVYGNNKPLLNMLHHYGVQACLDYAKNADLKSAEKKRNLQLGHYLKFIDTASHGYAIASVDNDKLIVEYVSFDKPLTDDLNSEGPPVVYRLRFNVATWNDFPQIKIQRVEGKLPLPYDQ